jgi:DNA-binding MarR family transcriptional regulator
MRKHRQGLSVPQFRALIKVRHEAGVSLSEVAEHLGASLPTASRIIAKLVNRGYLTRTESNKDRRQMVLHLTPLGRSLVDAAMESTQAQMETDLANLSHDQRDQVRDAMKILRGLFAQAGFPGAAHPWNETETAQEQQAHEVLMEAGAAGH